MIESLSTLFRIASNMDAGKKLTEVFEAAVHVVSGFKISQDINSKKENFSEAAAFNHIVEDKYFKPVYSFFKPIHNQVTKTLKNLASLPVIKQSVEAAKILKENPPGKQIVAASKKSFAIIMHPTTTSILSIGLCTIGVVGATVASGGLFLPAAALAVATTAACYNTYIKTSNVIEKRDIVAKDKCLNSIKDSILKQKLLMEKHDHLISKINGLKIPEVKKVEQDNSPIKSNLTKTVYNAIVEGAFELGTPIALGVISANPVLIGVGAVGAFFGGAAIIAEKHVEQINKKTIKIRQETIQKEVGLEGKNTQDLAKEAIEHRATYDALYRLQEDYKKDPNMSDVLINSKFAFYKDEEIKRQQEHFKEEAKASSLYSKISVVGEVLWPFSRAEEPNLLDHVVKNHQEDENFVNTSLELKRERLPQDIEKQHQQEKLKEIEHSKSVQLVEEVIAHDHISNPSNAAKIAEDVEPNKAPHHQEIAK